MSTNHPIPPINLMLVASALTVIFFSFLNAHYSAEAAAAFHLQRHSISGRRIKQERRHCRQLVDGSVTSLGMAVTPVGPFCPFRSSSAIEVEPKMEGLSQVGPEIATDLTRVQLDMQMGIMPDSDRLIKVATNIEFAVSQWELLVTRLRLSKDFQTREYAKLTQAHLESHDTSIQSVASMMRWQAACMKAMAANTPPPMPPSDIDLANMMNQAKEQQEGDKANPSSQPPSITAMTAAEMITATPFTGKEAAFDSPTVKIEYDQLCRDHMKLIEFGSKYDDFDPTGKLLYLDEIEKIHERWDIFFTRFKLLGALDDEYVRQCNNFLASMNMTEDQYRQLLKKCHDTMRLDAEIERNQI